MIKIKDLTHYLESIAPASLQESYDNSGLLVGNPNTVITGVMIALDSTEAVLDEAIAKGCNIVVAHHPIVFFGLKRFNGKGYVERTVMKAIKHDIALYAIHTNLDNIKAGVNQMICRKIGIQHTRILSPKKNLLKQLTVFVPQAQKTVVFEAMSQAGAGQLGDYSHWSFQTEGTGTFMPTDTANPTTGTANELNQVAETRIEVIFPDHLTHKVISVMQKAHPYETPAYFLQSLENDHPDIGSGMIGELETPMEAIAFLTQLKNSMDIGVIRHTNLLDKPIKRVAVCGGAGGFLLRKAIAQGADIFITADYKYHEFFDADHRIIIADIGHYESEQYTKELLQEFLKKKFGDELKLLLCDVNTNPVSYF